MNRIQKIFTNPNAVVVFVEDQLTLHYLEIIWQRELAMLNIVCAGSRYLVYEFTRNYQENKFDCWGIVDLDYNWNRPSNAQRIVRLQKHEIENYLLDSNAIYQSDFNYKKTGNNKKHSENEIETKISAFMNENRYWFACCYVLNKIKYDLRSDFPKNPNLDEISDLESIKRYIIDFRLVENTKKCLDEIDSDKLEEYIKVRLTEIDTLYKESKEIDFFPGKKVLNHVRGFLSVSVNTKNGAHIIDFAKQIAEIQYKNDTVPQEMTQIREKILAK